MFDGFGFFLRWIDGTMTAEREGCSSYHVRVTNEGRKVRSGYLPNESEYFTAHHRVMLVLVHIDVTPPQVVLVELFHLL
ncbi:hypothetical protein TNCV_2869871 [Trichonephila clavipes]|nr:hypothetical protein TNCV_2869871 [Trichonephila clavipes]